MSTQINPMHLLKQYFGYDTLRPGQERVINHILAGQSAAAIFPTGAGKSLCYQLPALQLPHLTLVISPLLALMHDQLTFLANKGIAAATIDSTQTPQQTQAVMQAVRAGTIKILMISVERLKNERFRHFIAQVPLSLLVIDEAHCISEWGHNFRPDYLKLPEYRQQLKIPQVLLLTATATPAVMADMQQKFAIANEQMVVTGFYRSNLDLQILPVAQIDRPATLLALLQQAPTAPTIVYVTQQHSSEEIAALLRQHGLHSHAYHAGMSSESRQAVQQQFMAGSLHCVVATIAFGMGIDKADIRRVIHYDLPKSIENYSQEIGRAGRDGQLSHCVVLASREQLPLLENFVYGDTPDQEGIRKILQAIQHSQTQPTEPGEWELSLLSLANHSNIRQLPLKTLLVYLELLGILTPSYSYFAEYRFKLNLSQEEIVSRFSGERQAFLSSVFRAAPLARSWCSLDLARLQQQGVERARAIRALEYLHEQGWIELESKQMTEVYRVHQTGYDLDELARQLHQQFLDKERSELARIQHMLAFFASSTCLSHTLASYFADNQAPQQCGHCSVCQGKPAHMPPLPIQAMISAAQLQAWCQPLLTASGQPQLPPRVLARYLCGITTPLTTRLKARSLPGFAKLEAYPFAQVLTQVEALPRSV